MPPRTKEPESKQGLIITLVFFVLATICLGVSTYFGFADQDAKDKAKKKAEDERKLMEDDRNFYKAQALVYRGYMGLTEGMEGAESLGTYKTQLEGGTLGKGSKDSANVAGVLKSLDANYGWNGNQPKNSLQDTIKTLNTTLDNTTKAKNKADTDLKNAKRDLQKRDDELQAARTDFEKKLVDLEKKYKDEFQKSDRDLAEFRAKFDQSSVDHKKRDETIEEERKAHTAALTRKDKEIADLKQLVQKKEGEISAFKIRNPEAPPSMRTDWRISYMDDSGTRPYINLGSADRVKPQLTFNIYGLGVDGRPNPQPKGTLEVVSVIGPHLSQTRITSEKDGRRDPITRGDVIFNASWNPTIKKHVAVAGTIDLTGDGRDSLPEFLRNLERQNIVVDAYQDLRDGSMKGQITYQTDFLILGGLPGKGGSGKAGEAEKRILEGRKHMEDDAKKYGVQVTNLLKYLEMIGYSLPHSGRAGAPTRTDTDYRSDIVPRLGRDKLVPSTPVRERPQGAPPRR